MQHKTKLEKKREQMSARLRKATLFRYRIIITLPPWGVLAVAGAITISMLHSPTLMTNIICLAITFVSLVFVLVARRTVKALRFEVHEALNNIGNEEIDTADYEPQPETITLKRMDNTNGRRSSRVSE